MERIANVTPIALVVAAGAAGLGLLSQAHPQDGVLVGAASTGALAVGLFVGDWIRNREARKREAAADQVRHRAEQYKEATRAIQMLRAQLHDRTQQLRLAHQELDEERDRSEQLRRFADEIASKYERLAAESAALRRDQLLNQRRIRNMTRANELAQDTIRYQQQKLREKREQAIEETLP